MKTASAILNYETIDSLECSITRLDNQLARIYRVNSRLIAGRRINRTSVLSILHDAEIQLREYREMAKQFKVACEVEEGDLEDIHPLPPQQSQPLPANVVLFRKKNRQEVTI